MREAPLGHPAVGLEGVYHDPKHGGCVRYVERLACDYAIRGAYGNDEAKPPGEWWSARIRVMDGHFLHVDFVGKTPRKTHRALWCSGVGEIHWDDGNVWRRLYG